MSIMIHHEYPIFDYATCWTLWRFDSQFTGKKAVWMLY